MIVKRIMGGLSKDNPPSALWRKMMSDELMVAVQMYQQNARHADQENARREAQNKADYVWLEQIEALLKSSF